VKNEITVTGRKLVISEATKRRNPHLFNPGGLEAGQPEPTPAKALVRNHPKQERRKDGLAVCISLTAIRRRLLDDDNNVGSFKPLRDAIAETIGIDDGSDRIQWRYFQQQTTGRECVAVLITLTKSQTGTKPTTGQRN